MGIFEDITERKRLEEEKEKVVVDLQKALSEVKKLSVFLPICASCMRKLYPEIADEVLGGLEKDKEK